MGTRKLEEHCQRLAPEIFRFIHVVTGEITLCEKLLWSVFEAVHIDRPQFIANMATNEETPEDRKNYQIAAFRQAYILADKKAVTRNAPHQNLFDTLSIAQKAVISLRYQTGFSLQETADIIEQEKSEVCSLLYRAREQLIPFFKNSLEETCRYSRQIPALAELDIEDTRFSFLRQHSLKCPSCAHLYEKVLRELKSIGEMIPSCDFPTKLRQTFEETLGTFLKGTLLKRKGWSQKIKQICLGF